MISRDCTTLILCSSRVPLHEPPLCAVRKPLFNSEVTSEHTAHHVWPGTQRCVFARVMPIASQVQIPKTLRSTFFAQNLKSRGRIPLSASCSPGPHHRLDLDCVIMFLGHSSAQRSVMLVSIPPDKKANEYNQKESVYDI